MLFINNHGSVVCGRWDRGSYRGVPPENVALFVCQCLSGCPVPCGRACPASNSNHQLREIADSRLGQGWLITLPKEVTLGLFPAMGVVQMMQNGRLLTEKVNISGFAWNFKFGIALIGFLSPLGKRILGVSSSGSTF